MVPGRRNQRESASEPAGRSVAVWEGSRESENDSVALDEPTDRKVYDSDTRCTEGNNIEDRYRRSGTDGRQPCRHCARLT